MWECDESFFFQTAIKQQLILQSLMSVIVNNHTNDVQPNISDRL